MSKIIPPVYMCLCMCLVDHVLLQDFQWMSPQYSLRVVLAGADFSQPAHTAWRRGGSVYAKPEQPGKTTCVLCCYRMRCVGA